MTACFLTTNTKLKLLPAPPSWFFFILAFGISAVVACKAHSATIWGERVVFTVAQADIKELPAKKQKTKRRKRRSKVGRKAAEKYFQDKNGDLQEPEANRPADHFLAVHVGTYLNGDAFSWGSDSKQEDSGQLTAGVTYRMGEWVRSMDLLLRADFNTYELPQGKPSKISLMPIIQFPEASSKFPLYFGLGLGLGVYTKQVGDESDLSIDYQLLAGLRFFNVFRSTGFFVESGVKNHFHILSSGQFNGVFLSAGSVFTF